MIRNNLFYKLLALGVAIGLWTYVNSEQNPHARKIVTVPLEVRSLAKGYVSDLSAREVNLTIQGLKTVVDGVRKEDVAAWADLGGLPAGRSVASDSVSVRYRISGVSMDDLDVVVSPKKVHVRVEALSGKRLPVEVKFLSAPPLGYSYSDPQITPASIGVSGKVTQVEKVKRVMLPISESPDGTGIDGQFKVAPVDSKGNVVTGVQLDRDTVRLKLDLVEVPATKTVVVSQNIAGQPKFPFKVTDVTIDPPSVTLEGKPSTLVAASTVSTDPVSIENATETVSQEVGLRLPPGVRVLGRNKVRVTIRIGGKAEPAVKND